ncbi:TPA: hypothetical protein HA297_03775 [Candidatus Woesearchaeota archaeon]|nr:hypothetical protein [Candidatus Woesearchaeota archaeon]
MATLLDIGLASQFQMVFSFFFVVAVVYGVLALTKFFGDNKPLYALIAILLGILVLLIPDVSSLINIMTPWFVFLFIFLVFLLITYKIFGATEMDIASALKDRAVVWVILIIAVIIVIGSFASVFGQRLLERGSGSDLRADAGDGRTIIDARTGRVIREVPGAGGRGLARDSVAGGSYGQNLLSTLLHPKVLGFGLMGLIALFTIAILAMAAKL